ncbi:hypothetical protein HQ489_00010 [Candidatus Woesearchaeota archaeon]|nr:hypothetical protein [Candidatus Woesearchaeota archaeon]
MAKKTTKTTKTTKKTSKPTSIKPVDNNVPAPSALKLSPEMEKKLKDLKDKLDKFKDQVLDKFGDYIVGITLLPPEDPKILEKREEELKEVEKQTGKKQVMPSKDDINLLIVVDDTTSKKMTKDELHQKFSTIITKIGGEVDAHIKPQSILLTDLWQNCYDAKYDLNKLISMGAPIHDTGMLAAIKISEIHKTMVLKKFEKYILSYVLAGSLTQGRATPTSDIDVWIVIDDTDVKKMTRLELKDKLRAIIIGMGMEAGEMTGIKNKLNIQVYILTDFWDSLKEANPIIFTLLRDGVPFYDRGIFMPWKQLLRMGRIKPSREAIDLFMNTGEQSLKRIKGKLKEMGMEDTYYAILTPSQAAIMMYGLPPPTPRETPEVLEKIFVKQEKMLEPEYVNILKKNVQIRKEIEHGTMKELSGKELDTLITNAEKFLKRIDQLFKQIEQMHNEKSINLLYDEVVTLTRDVLKLEGIEKVQEPRIMELFEEELVSSGKVPARFTRDLKEVFDAKKKFDAKKLDKTDIENARKSASVMIKFLIEHIQRKRGQEMERAKIRVKYGEKYGEVILLDTVAFIMHNIDNKDQMIEKADIQADGGLGPIQKSDFKELEKALMEKRFPKRVFIKDAIFEDLKNIFGRDVEVLLHY